MGHQCGRAGFPAGGPEPDLRGRLERQHGVRGRRQPGSWWIPELRLGYRQNLAGSELSLLSVGVSLLRVVNLDVGYGLEKTHYEGDTYPRTAAVNLGVEAQF